MPANSSFHREIFFEDDLVNHLLENGWVGGEKSPGYYDAKSALVPSDVLEWVVNTYPDEWSKLEASKGKEGASVLFIKKLIENLDQYGPLHVLRHGFKVVGAGSTFFAMASFKPAFSHNAEELEKYERNKCRVARQVHYSPYRTDESIDVMLFLNGIPVSSLELKTDSTQSVDEAIYQYKTDRPIVDPKTRSKEPLLQFNTRCLVHFAVSTEEVHMTTRLNGKETFFLPFNLGYNEGKGNPPNPNGIKTSYLWERILQRDNWLHVIGRFIHHEKKRDESTGKVKESLIFPRFHQWDCVTDLVKKVQEEGAGFRYLIQHSAGSGKSNSIAWLAHHLSSLHRSEVKLFDSVIIVTDRTVLDNQLQETVYQFEHKDGVVERITDSSGSKSSKLGEALLKKKPIIIVTIQTFGFVIKHIAESAALKGRNFAVIVDEAHTSQTGSSASKLKQALGYEPAPDEEVSSEDIILAEMAAQAGNKYLSYFAFTATPKSKTMELFGRKGDDGKLRPCHVYSMQQAIEERYILDVLQNYTPYKVAWKLAHNGKDYDENFVDKSEAAKQLVKWVRLHPHNIAQKVAIIVEHFRENVSGRLNGQAKAMVVTASRQEVVRYKRAIDSYIRENKYPMATLVAFSGEVIDKEIGGEEFTEKSMNGELKGRDIRAVFDTSDYQLLLVANKYQTGFDQPKLVAMYVDKKLGGVATVQTLSRLNRTYPGKDWTVVIDFVNKPEDILADFQVYYRSATMPVGSDPELLLKLQTKLDMERFYVESEVEAFAQFYWSQVEVKKAHSELQKLIGPPLQRIRDRYVTARRANDDEAVEAVRMLVKDVGTYVKLYEFLSQILNYEDTDLAKRYVLFKHLLHPLSDILRNPDVKDGIDLSGVNLSHYSAKSGGSRKLELDPSKENELPGIGGAGTGQSRIKERGLLSEIIAKLNDLFEGELTDIDMVNYVNTVCDKLFESDELIEQAANNSKSQFAQGNIREMIIDAVIEHREANNHMAGQLLADEQKLKSFSDILIDMAWNSFENKRKVG